MVILSLIYFVSRIPFLRAYPVFYDSFEYLRLAERLDFSNLTEILRSTHQPIHTLYFLTILIFKKILFFLSPAHTLVFISIIFGYLTVLLWYRFVRNVSNEKEAFCSSLLVLAFPYFFVANTNILYESELLFFQILGLLLYLKRKPLLAGFAFAAGQLIFIGSVILLPVFFLTKRSSFLLFLIVSMLIYLLSDLFFLKTSGLLLGKYGYHIFNVTSTQQGLFITATRVLRAIITQSSAVLSITGFTSLLAATTILLRRKKWKTLSFGLWIVPLFFIMQYWPVGLYGRLALFLVFPSSLIIASALSKSRLLFTAIVIFVSLTTLHYALEQTQTAPLYLYSSSVQRIKKNNDFVFITSDFNRFLYEKNHQSIFVFNGLDQNVSQAEQFIQTNLQEGKRVIIDSAGLTYPYYQFDGSFYHILSLRKIGDSLAKNVLEKFEFKPIATDRQNGQIFFLEITKPSEQSKTVKTTVIYPKGLYSINRRQPYLYDPLANLFYLITRKKDPEYWTYVKM